MELHKPDWIYVHNLTYDRHEYMCKVCGETDNRYHNRKNSFPSLGEQK